MTDEQKKCQHEFEYDGQPETYTMTGKGDLLERTVTCPHCHLIAREVWVFEGNFDLVGNKI